MRVLVACEFSGVVRNAFRERNHDAWSCDFLDSEDSSNYHIKGDVLDTLSNDWDLMIAHPPCTRLCNSGVRWLHKPPANKSKERIHKELDEALEFFLKLLNAPIPKICIENPIPHKYAREIIGNYTQLIQPWQFGHGEKKATCLWLKNLPKLIPTDIVDGREPRIHYMAPSKDRWKERSRTYKGVADAMADQWDFQV